MRRHVLVAGSLAAVLVLGACGGGSSKASPTTPTAAGQPATVTYPPAGPNPSVSAKMVCQKEAQEDIAGAIEVTATKVTTPTWNDHLYSCTYVYPNGKIVLSVKELSTDAETTAYFNSLATKYGKRQPINGLAQGAFITTNDNVVVRKDYKVLLVDVAGIPKNFAPATTRTDVAENIAAAIMSCWSGA
jgi:hypothetical protein